MPPGVSPRRAARGCAIPQAAGPSAVPVAPGSRRAAEATETNGLRLHGMKPCQDVDHGGREVLRAVLAQRQQLPRTPVGGARHVFHHVELGSDHRGIGRVGVGPRDGHIAVAQRCHHPELASHVVSGGLHVPKRWSSHDPPMHPVGHQVGEVRLAAGDQQARRPAPRSPGHICSYHLWKAVRSSPGIPSGRCFSLTGPAPTTARPSPTHGAFRRATGRCRPPSPRSTRRPPGGAGPGTGCPPRTPPTRSRPGAG